VRLTMALGRSANVMNFVVGSGYHVQSCVSGGFMWYKSEISCRGIFLLNFKLIFLEMPFFYHKYLNNVERQEVDIFHRACI